MEWLADRFFFEDGRWLDAATGRRVRIYVEHASPADAFDWDEQCGRLFNVRHPLLNPLVDYGPAPGNRRFEAYELSPTTTGTGRGAERLLVHLPEFLRSVGISLAAPRSQYAVRQIGSGANAPDRPLGLTLQPRRALEAARETLESPAAAPALLNIVGAPLSGLRTSQLLVARVARVLGFVPVCPGVLANRPAAAELLRERHLCLLAGDELTVRRALAAALVQLSAASTRRHVVVQFTRGRTQRGAIRLDPLPIRALVGMVFATQEGPTEQELFEAARFSEGRPGAFLAYLAAGTAAAAQGAMVVHETPQEYVLDPSPAPAVAPSLPRMLSVALRAPARAQVLARRGRHTAARRALERGARVLAGRDRAEEAAECLVGAGWLALDRGRPADAARLFSDARERSPSGAAAIRAAAGLGASWIDDLRFVEAEAVLRGALSAAQTVGDSAGALLALAGLVRCLYHQDRSGDAVAAAASVDWREDDRAGSAQLLAVLSRCHSALGRTATAMQLARRAQELAAAGAGPHAAIGAELALAEALGAAGDRPGMQERLRRVCSMARSAHLPIEAIRAEVALCEQSAGGDKTERERALRRLRVMKKLALPRILADRISATAQALEQPQRATRDDTPQAARESHREAAEALEMLLQVCQQAADDPAAIAAICAAVQRRLQAATVMVLAVTDRRVLACEGRGWVAHSSVVAQALVTGTAAATDAGVEPREAAEGIRYGGEIVGAIACRWTAGAPVDPDGAAAILHAAALAVAAPMRAVLDRALPPPPAAAWGDLLGESSAATALRDAVVRAARAPFPVLIEGESGCGKELVARAVHRLGARRDRRFCPLNCAALTDELVEAELFGHSRGAFTGAATERAGLFEEADGGTLFLDEIGELSARAQAKLLRVLQEGEVRRVGENFARRVDTRIVAATNRQLESEVTAGRFRTDLRFRLDVIRIAVPPLRERPGDIPVLAAHFWSGASKSVGSQATLSPDTLAALARYDWPGNVRELQNVIAWIAVHSPRRGRIGPSALPAHVARSAKPVAHTFEAAREEFDRRFIRAALAGANGQRARAAEALGITRQGLAKIMKRLKIDAGAE